MGQLARYGSTTNGKEILENLVKFKIHVLLKLKRINLETSVYIKLFLFFFRKYVCSHEMISSNG